MIRDLKLQESKGALDNKGLDSNSQQSVNKDSHNPKINNENLLNNFNLNDTLEQKEKDIILNYDDYELNSFEYSLALEFDNRKFFRVYWSLLKREHLIIFTFFSWKDYNIFPIKLSKFFYLICTDMTLNMFFFSDESMHNVYKSGGKYNLFEQFFQLIISTLISQSLQIFLNFLTMTDIHYYGVKSLNKDKMNKEKVISIINCVKYKIIIFYVFTFLLFLFYWYVIAAFCAVYVNTQRIFITNSVLSFCLGLLCPFAIYTIPTGLRFLSLSAKKRKNLKILYILSNIIPFF